MSTRCSALTPHGPCRRFPKPGHPRCYKHGNADGAGRPPTRGEAWAKLLGPAWNVIRSGEMRDLDGDIAVHLVRERELMLRLEDGDSPPFRALALSHLEGLRAAAAQGDREAMGTSLNALEGWLRDGCDRDATWVEILELSARRARLTEQATAIETKNANALTGRAIVNLLALVVDLVRQEVGDDGAYRVGNRLEQTFSGRMAGGEGPKALPSGTDGGGGG